jgi:hypothetical protein
LSDKDFKVKNKLQVKGITSAGPVVSDASGNLDSTAYVATQYGGTGTTTSPSSGQILYSSSGTTYAPTALTSLDVKGASYSADAPSSPVVGQIWVESDSSVTPFDSNIIRRQAFTSTAGQTVYTTNIAFIDGYEQVFFNGMLLLRTTDYTTSGNNTITLTAAAAVNDIVEVVTVTNFNSVNTYTQGEIDTALSAKLSTSTAASTYLTQSNASSTYLTSSTAASTYLTSSNAASTYLTSGTAASTYLSQSNAATTYVPQTSYSVAGKNKIINGDFSVWQRGTTVTAGTYTADRWVNTGGSGTVSRQAFTPGTAPVAGYESQYYLNWTITADQINNEMLQRIEDARTFAGQTVTLSFWARSTVGAQPLNVAIYQHFGTGGSPSSLTGATLISGGSPYTPTSSWQRFTFTFTVPSVSGKTFGTDNNSFLWVRPAQFTTTATNTSLDIWGVQLEAGSVATPFSISTPNKQSELAACQRYYLRYGGNQAYETFPGVLISYSTTQGEGPIAFKSTMRTTPTVTFSTLKISDVATYNIAVSNLTITTNVSGPDAAYLVFTVAGGVTAGKTNLLRTDGSTSGYLAFSAEL